MTVQTWPGGPVGDWAYGVLAANPGPMTLDGTNTWVLGAPGAPRVVVVDPGPDDVTHLEAVRAAVGARAVAAVVLTHDHLDHSEGAAAFADAVSAPVRAVRDGSLAGGDLLDVDGLMVEVIATPGHTADSACLLVPDAHLLLTGDTVLGRGSAVVAAPDGRLGAYLDSLRTLHETVAARAVTHVLPGHGPVRDDPGTVVEFYMSHRQARLAQVRDAVADGAVTARDVVERVYTDVPRELWPAAEQSVQAQLDYLATD